jgi:hypothetical protein
VCDSTLRIDATSSCALTASGTSVSDSRALYLIMASIEFPAPTNIPPEMVQQVSGFSGRKWLNATLAAITVEARKNPAYRFWASNDENVRRRRYTEPEDDIAFKQWEKEYIETLLFVRSLIPSSILNLEAVRKVLGLVVAISRLIDEIKVRNVVDGAHPSESSRPKAFTLPYRSSRHEIPTLRT